MGCVSIWKPSDSTVSASKESRAEKGIEQLKKLLQEYPKENVKVATGCAKLFLVCYEKANAKLD